MIVTVKLVVMAHSRDERRHLVIRRDATCRRKVGLELETSSCCPTPAPLLLVLGHYHHCTPRGAKAPMLARLN